MNILDTTDLLLRFIASGFQLDRAGGQFFDEKAIEKAREFVKDKTPPTLLYIYLGGLDSYVHGNGTGPVTASGESIGDAVSYVQDLQPRVKEIVDDIKAAKLFEHTVFLLYADHGATNMSNNPDRTIQLGELQAPVAAAPRNLATTNEKLASGDFDVVAALDGPVAHVYVRNNSTNKWTDPPRFQQDLLPVARQLLRASVDGAFDPKLQNSFAHILVRRFDVAGFSDAFYQRITGFVGDTPTLADISDAMGTAADFRVQRYRSMRSGDIVVITRFDAAVAHADRRAFGSAPLRANHGSLSDADSLVPFLVAYAGGERKRALEDLGKVADDLKEGDRFFNHKIGRMITRIHGIYSIPGQSD